MKKTILFIFVALIASGISYAQRNNIDPKIQAARDMKAIESKMLKEKTDEEGMKLIKQHRAAKKRMDDVMKTKPGYGKSATDKEKLKKFREKTAKGDPEFKKLSDKETSTRKAKEDYISNADPEYKKLRGVRGG